MEHFSGGSKSIMYKSLDGGVINLYGLWDWVGMALCMGPMSPLRAHSLWAGLCPEKLVNK